MDEKAQASTPVSTQTPKVGFKKYALVILVIVVVVLGIIAVVTSALFLTKSAEASRNQATIDLLTNELEDLGTTILPDGTTTDIECDDTTATCPDSHVIDIFLGLDAILPSPWGVDNEIVLQNDFTYDEATAASGQLATEYVVKLTKGATSLQFEKMLGGIGLMPFGVSAEYQGEVLSDELIRYRYIENPDEPWMYSDIVPCDDVDPMDLNGATVCAMRAVGLNSAVFVMLSGDASSDDLAEADAIMLSATD